MDQQHSWAQKSLIWEWKSKSCQWASPSLRPPSPSPSPSLSLSPLLLRRRRETETQRRCWRPRQIYMRCCRNKVTFSSAECQRITTLCGFIVCLTFSFTFTLSVLIPKIMFSLSLLPSALIVSRKIYIHETPRLLYFHLCLSLLNILSCFETLLVFNAFLNVFCEKRIKTMMNNLY